ncbi:MAG: D-alanyl-D-alanine carboxypeptidase [Methylococcaceae bacterium]|nr:D-alanyl-D-alanine carboxypeptidase [Methylococcaceae bacterium]
MRITLNQLEWFGNLIQSMPVLLFLAIVLSPPEAKGYPGIVIESGSGKVLQHEDANQSWHPASLTKLMTLYLTFNALHSGQLNLDEQLTASAFAASQPPTRLGLRHGDRLTVGEAIQAVATISANDASVVLAERLKGSEALFAEEMTRQAKQLGMHATEFFNASGLPNLQQKTTARDMALLAMRLIKSFPDYFHYFSNRSITFRGRHRMATNGFISSYPGADGLKTGYTCGSGYNLIATALRDNVRLIGVVLGAGSKRERSTQMRKLLDLGFTKVREPAEVPTITGIALNQPAEFSAPPFRLKGCASRPVQSIAQDDPLPVQTLTKEGSLPGWGVLLGIQRGKNDALSVVKKARSELERVRISSTPALLKRKFRKGSSWKILLVGLEKAQAGQACRHLLAHAVNCVIQSPKRMNSRGYARR